MPIRVAIVEDQSVYRAGLCHIISSSNACELVGEGSNREDALRLASERSPEVMLLDGEMPGGSIDILRTVTTKARNMRTVLLSNSGNEKALTEAFQAGARGYVDRSVKRDQLIDIVGSVHRGQMYMEPSLASLLLTNKFDRISTKDTLLASLTVREEKILKEVARGQTNKEIARAQGLAEKTVKHYMTSILQKLQARNRVEAALIAREQFGWS
ncbi:MAG: LuxR C-terminal-related transcriptional regulator [Hyphomicrobiaceae bacterium]